MRQHEEYWRSRTEKYHLWLDRLGHEHDEDMLDGSLGIRQPNPGSRVPHIEDCDQDMDCYMTNLKQTNVYAYFMIRSLVTGEFDSMKREAEIIFAQEIHRMERAL
jgi:hypothetical protein